LRSPRCTAEAIVHAAVRLPSLPAAASAESTRQLIVVVLVDAGHVMRVQRVVSRCEGVESVLPMPLGRHTQVRLEVCCDAMHVEHVVAELDACVRKGDIGRLSRFVVDPRVPTS
jgi:hypothetical protein